MEKEESAANAKQQSSTAMATGAGRTWFPILAGVLGGMIAFYAIAWVEHPSFYRLTVWIFNETDARSLFAYPAYYCVHRTILLLITGIGGYLGLLSSQWPYVKRIGFLMGTLVVVAIFAAFGFR